MAVAPIYHRRGNNISAANNREVLCAVLFAVVALDIEILP